MARNKKTAGEASASPTIKKRVQFVKSPTGRFLLAYSAGDIIPEDNPAIKGKLEDLEKEGFIRYV